MKYFGQLQHYNTSRNQFLLFAVFISIVLLVAYGFGPRVFRFGVPIPYYDKLGHFILIGLLAFFAHRASGRRTIRVGRFDIPLAPMLIAGIFTLEEGLQYFSAIRNSDVSDWVMNNAGILTFYQLDKFLVRLEQE